MISNIYASPFHRALREVVLTLDGEQSPGVLDRAAADELATVEPAWTIADRLLRQCGLRVQRTTLAHLTDVVAAGRVLLGLGDARFVVVSAKSRRRANVTIIDSDGSVTRRDEPTTALASALGHDRQTVWLAVASLGGLATMVSTSDQLTPWRRLWSLVRLEKRDITAAAVYAASVGALTLVAPIATQSLVNTIAFGTLVQPLIVLTLALLVGLSLSGGLAVLQAYVVEVVQRRLLVRVAEDFGERLPQVIAATTDRKDLVELNNRFFDVVTVQKSAAELLLSGLALVLQTSVGMMLLGFYHPLLLVFALLLLGCIAGIIASARGGTDTAIAESKAKFSIAAWLDELARRPHHFYAGHGRALAAETLSHRVRRYIRARKSHFRRVFTVLVGGVALQAFAVVALLGIGGWLVIQRELSLGQLVAAEIVVGAIAIGVAKFGRLAEKTFDMLAAVDKLGAVLDLPLRPAGSDPLAATGRGLALSGRALRTRYGEDGSPLFAPLELDISAGDKVLVDGRAASGRSALLEALAGLRPVVAGDLRWDGHSRPRSDDAALAITLVRPHDTIAATIFANLRLGNSALSTQQAWDCLTKVGLDGVVDALPKGLDTVLTPAGAPLSRSQAFRLSLARALAAAPRLLLIDGVLDHLGDDDETEQLCALLLAADRPWTAVVVSDDPRVQRWLPTRLPLTPAKDSAVTPSSQGGDA